MPVQIPYLVLSLELNAYINSDLTVYYNMEWELTYTSCSRCCGDVAVDLVLHLIALFTSYGSSLQDTLTADFYWSCLDTGVSHVK